MNSHNKNKDGFTIIEVVLVLAIAGLIFLMVFIALPALQRSNRDSAKRTEVGSVAAAITTYMGNNRNQSPTQGSQIASYVTGENSAFLDSGTEVIVVTTSASRGNSVTLTAAMDTNAPGENDTSDTIYKEQIKVYFGYECDTSSSANTYRLERGTSKQSAVVAGLESGPATGTIYCQSS